MRKNNKYAKLLLHRQYTSMRTPSTLRWAFLLFAMPLFAADGIDSYVTRTGTPQDFDLGATHIVCTPATQTITPVDTAESKSIPGCLQQIYGQRLVVTGKLDNKTHTLTADTIELIDLETGRDIDGFSFIDAVLSPTLLRADGHAIVIDSNTKITRENDLTPADSPATRQWVKYEGVRRADGAILATSLTFSAPEITKTEKNLRKKSEFDPAKNNEENKQSGASKFFLGKDYKRIPASKDTALQARIEAIGNKLIPAYQRSLTDGDPHKINFRFQLVHGIKYQSISFPSGIILVEERAVKVLPNDDQIAYVMADAIAIALERQEYRYLPGYYTMAGTQTAAEVAGLFVPGLGLVAWAGNHVALSKIQKTQGDQASRLALIMLHDAGYDITQALIADWHLEKEKPDFMQRSIPYRAAFLFQTLATDWRPDSPLRQQHP
ncbi:MAG: hypothetical protein JSS87_08800 [Acidobacteria bacterium]|nr:hypothetical protein [Acidobacteriota bacterium]